MMQFNQNQHLAMLEEIAVSAARVVEMARMIQGHSGDELDVDVLAAAVALTGQRIGWMADAAAKAHLCLLPEAVTADSWNMPAMVLAEGGSAATGGKAEP